jgi:hypothetical protein
MKTTTRMALGLASSLLLSAGFLHAAQSLDPMTKSAALSAQAAGPVDGGPGLPCQLVDTDGGPGLPCQFSGSSTAQL